MTPRGAHQNWAARRSRGPARTLSVLAALVMLALQAFVVQTHIHAFASTNAAVIASVVSDDDHATHVSATHAQIGCELCALLAASGRALASDAFTLAEIASAHTEAATVALHIAPRALSHIWRSRAPPLAL